MKAKLETVPDTDPELELRVLCAMLLDWRACKVGVDMLTPGMLYAPRHQTAFDCLSVAFARGEELDELLLARLLEARHWQRNDARQFAGSVVTAGGSPGCIEQYCVALRELHERRETQRLAGDMAFSHVTPAQAIKRLEALAPPDESVKAASIDALSTEIEAEIAGERYAAGVPQWPVWCGTQFLQPSTVTLLCGTEGVSKSFLAIELLRGLWELGLNVCALMLESGAEFHLRRAVVQAAGMSELMTPSWVRQNPDEARKVIGQFKELREAFRTCVEAPAPRQRIDCDFLLKWLRGKCMAGARVLIIDPVSIMQGSERRFLDHERFVIEAKAIMREYGASLICITHPRAGPAGAEIMPALENIPNSTAWRRFGDFVFWLHRPKGKKDHAFEDSEGRWVTRDYNRELHCLKVRMSSNPGVIAYYLDGKTMRHVERGPLGDDVPAEPKNAKKYKPWPWSK